MGENKEGSGIRYIKQMIHMVICCSSYCACVNILIGIEVLLLKPTFENHWFSRLHSHEDEYQHGDLPKLTTV